MIWTGRISTLAVHHIDERGAWLDATGESVLLPKREIPHGTVAGDRLTVFVTRDPSGAYMASLRLPKAQVGEFALLTVKDVTKHGAFLDWGVEKELLIPFSEQPERMKPGHSYLVKVCLDSLGRTVGTARIDRCLETEEIRLEEGQSVGLTVWEFTDLGAKVIVDDLYPGLLYRDEFTPSLKRGDRIDGYVKRIREDGKIDVTLRRSGAEGARDARENLLETLKKEGFLPLHDQSSPETIREALGMSKKAFKKAVGGLYKEGLIELTSEGIKLTKR